MYIFVMNLLRCVSGGLDTPLDSKGIGALAYRGRIL
jgi:hypothetical protein